MRPDGNYVRLTQFCTLCTGNYRHSPPCARGLERKRKSDALGVSEGPFLKNNRRGPTVCRREALSLYADRLIALLLRPASSTTRPSSPPNSCLCHQPSDEAAQFWPRRRLARPASSLGGSVTAPEPAARPLASARRSASAPWPSRCLASALSAWALPPIHAGPALRLVRLPSIKVYCKRPRCARLWPLRSARHTHTAPDLPPLPVPRR